MFCVIWDMECPYDDDLVSDEFCETCVNDRLEEVSYGNVGDRCGSCSPGE